MDEISLMEVVDAVLALYDESDGLTVKREDSNAAVLAHGWYTLVRRTARAVLIMGDNGFGQECAPLRRTMMEHALALHWLSQASQSAVDAVAAMDQQRWLRIQKNMTPGWALAPEEINPILAREIAVSSESTYTAFKHLCDRYGQRDLYVAWLLETSHSHPSLASAESYAVRSADAHSSTQLRDQAEKNPESQAATCGVLLLIASRGFDQIQHESPWSDELSTLENKLQRATTVGHPVT